MATTLTPTTFSTGAKDDLATADIYKNITGFPINDITTVQALNSLDLAGDLRGNQSMQDRLFTKPIGSDANPSSNSIADLLSSVSDKLSGPLGGAKGSIDALLSTLPKSLTTGLISDISNRTGYGNVGNYASASVNGSLSRISLGNYGDARNIIGGVGAAGCANNNLGIFNQNMLIWSLLSILSRALGLGMNNMFGALLCMLPNTNSVNVFATRSLPTVLNNGDIGSLSTMAGVTSPGLLRTVNPNIPGDYGRSFSIPSGTNRAGINNIYGTTTNTFSRIDGNWNTYSRNTTNGTDSAVNISSMVNGSNDYRDMMYMCSANSNDPNEQLYGISKVVTPTNPLDDLKKHFPFTSLNNLSTATTNFGDTVGPTLIPRLSDFGFNI